MNSSSFQVFLNRFSLKKLDKSDKTVYVYSYKFTSPPEPGKEISAVKNIPYGIKTPGVKFGSSIITKQPIKDFYLNHKNWKLQPEGTKLLNPDKLNERRALEELERRWLGMKLRTIGEKHRVDNASEGGYIWWNAEKTILKDSGWEVHTGVRLDIRVNELGILFAEIDSY